MGLCNTVSEAADALARAKLQRTPRQVVLISILRLMPAYRNMQDLSAWETAFKAALPEQDDTSEVGKMIDEVFGLGSCNLYQGYRVENARSAFERVKSVFARNGLAVRDCGLDDW